MDKPHDDVERYLGRAGCLVHRHDMGMFQTGNRPRLAQIGGGSNRTAVRKAVRNLDRDRTLKNCVERFIHRTETAASQQFADFKLGNPGWHCHHALG